MDDQKFADTLERAREGDRDAMSALVEEYQPQILRVARRRLGPAMRTTFDSMDLVQSVHRSLILSLRRNKFTFDGPQDLVALAVTMIKRKVARKAARLKRGQEILELQTLVQVKAKPGRSAKAAEQLQGLLESLNDFDRQLLKLYLEGHGTNEAAQILGVDPNSLRVHKSRLRRKLRVSGLDLE
jgi:RNA polymerase sigma factor (sigma-70 family)